MEKAPARERIDEDLNLEPEVVESGSDTSSEIYEEEQWGDQLHALVQANQDIIVVCPWMNDDRVSLGTAMTTYEYPSNLSAADEPFLISVVYDLLANVGHDDEEIEELAINNEEEIAELQEETLKEEQSAKSELKIQEEGNEQEAQTEATGATPVPLKAKDHSLKEVSIDLKHPSSLHRGGKYEKPIELGLGSGSVSKQIHTSHISTIDNKEAAALQEAIGREYNIINAPEVAKAVVPEAVFEPELDQVYVPKLQDAQTGLSESEEDVSVQQMRVETPQRADIFTRAIKTELPVDLGEGVTLTIEKVTNLDEATEPSLVTEEDLQEHTVRDDETLEESSGLVDSVVLDQELPSSEELENLDTTFTEEGPAEQANVEFISLDDPSGLEGSSDSLDAMVEDIAKAKAQISEKDLNSIDLDKIEVIEDIEELIVEILDERGVAWTPELTEELIRRTYIRKNQELEDEDADDDNNIVVTKKKKATSNSVMLDSRLISKVAFDLCGFKMSLNLN